MKHGITVIELPFQPHREIPAGGIPAGPRSGAMYTMLELEAQNAGLPLRWPARLPNTRLALAAAEWTRRYQLHEFSALQRALFAAHFALGEDIGNDEVIRRHAGAVGVNVAALDRAFADGTALGFVAESEALGRHYGVHGTPAWLLNQQLISGLLSAEQFERLATQLVTS